MFGVCWVPWRAFLSASSLCSLQARSVYTTLDRHAVLTPWSRSLLEMWDSPRYWRGKTIVKADKCVYCFLFSFILLFTVIWTLRSLLSKAAREEILFCTIWTIHCNHLGSLKKCEMPIPSQIFGFTWGLDGFLGWGPRWVLSRKLPRWF